MSDLSEEVKNLLKLFENEDNWVCWQDNHEVKHIQHTKSQITLWLDYIDNFFGTVNIKVYNSNFLSIRGVFSDKENRLIRKLVRSTYKKCLKKRNESQRISKINSFKSMACLLEKYAKCESEQSNCPSIETKSC